MIKLVDFKGHWTVSRQISNAKDNSEGQFDGSARFTPDAEGLHYCEVGELMLPGQGRFKAQRQYLWRQNGAQIVVLFDNGRAFHQFDPATPDPAASHLCDPDTYHVTYDFEHWPNWSATWAVSGPRKSYVMRSCYRPGAGAET